MKLIQVVEDEHGHAEVLRMVLESSGHRVAIAWNGKLALEQMEQTSPALILTDFMMPVMTGAELGKVVRLMPQLRDIPIVILSGTDEAVVRENFSDYDAFVPKPYELSALLAVIGGLLASGRPQSEASKPDPSTQSEPGKALE